MTQYQNSDLDEMLSLLSFRKKPVICITNGSQIAVVEEILVDPGHLRLSAVVTSKGGLLRPEVRAIPAEFVQVWGEDAVLVTGPDVIRKKRDLSGLEKCISAFDSITGRDIITLNGERAGELGDMLVTLDGRLGGIEVDRERPELSDLFGGRSMHARPLPIAAVHSLGKDVLILDYEQVRTLAGIPAEPVLIPETSSTSEMPRVEAVEEVDPGMSSAEVQPHPVETTTDRVEPDTAAGEQKPVRVDPESEVYDPKEDTTPG
jgi:uncharacterized protein YrrD